MVRTDSGRGIIVTTSPPLWFPAEGSSLVCISVINWLITSFALFWTFDSIATLGCQLCLVEITLLSVANLCLEIPVLYWSSGESVEEHGCGWWALPLSFLRYEKVCQTMHTAKHAVKALLRGGHVWVTVYSWKYVSLLNTPLNWSNAHCDW